MTISNLKNYSLFPALHCKRVATRWLALAGCQVMTAKQCQVQQQLSLLQSMSLFGLMKAMFVVCVNQLFLSNTFQEN